LVSWTKARLWPEELEGRWVWQWNKYGDPAIQPESVFVPLGLQRNMKNCWGKWWASQDFDHVHVRTLDLPADGALPFSNLFGEDFLVAHFGAASILRYPEVVERFVEKKVSVPNNIAIVTFATDNIAPHALLLRQLDNCGIPYTNLAYHSLPRDQIWAHRYKFPGLVEALPRIEQEYVLVADGSDVLLFQSLDSIVERFNAYRTEVLFNAQKTRWPTYAEVPGEDDIDYGCYRYLNSGVCFGRPQAVASFWERAWKLLRDNKITNDQLPCRMAFCERRDTTELDYRCSLFQNVNSIKYDCQSNLLRVI